MTLLEKLELNSWEGKKGKSLQNLAIRNLERGRIIYLPTLNFALKPGEEKFLNPAQIDPKRKNISYDLKKRHLGGSLWQGEEEQELKAMLHRYATGAQKFLKDLFPGYAPHLILSKTSLRPAEISGRPTSVRKDDTRLHVDAFPSNPTQGLRLLRIFTNINSHGKARVWRVGEPFEDVARKFSLKVAKPIPGAAYLLKLLSITKKVRTPYDHYMLQIHNKMKEDGKYQKLAAQEEIHFPPGSTWIVFTDQVSHAALSGKDLLEQTFFLPAKSLKDPSCSPLKILEKLLKRPLI